MPRPLAMAYTADAGFKRLEEMNMSSINGLLVGKVEMKLGKSTHSGTCSGHQRFIARSWNRGYKLSEVLRTIWLDWLSFMHRKGHCSKFSLSFVLISLTISSRRVSHIWSYLHACTAIIRVRLYIQYYETRQKNDSLANDHCIVSLHCFSADCSTVWTYVSKEWITSSTQQDLNKTPSFA